MLVKRFGVEPISDSDIVRTSSCDVYAMVTENGDRKVNRYSGVRFEKHGLVFHAYKKGGYWTVIIPSVGLGIGIVEKSKAVAVQRVTEDLAALIRERVSDSSEMRELFVKLMQECEFDFALEGADFAALVTESLPIAETVDESLVEEPCPAAECDEEPRRGVENVDNKSHPVSTMKFRCIFLTRVRSIGESRPVETMPRVTDSAPHRSAVRPLFITHHAACGVPPVYGASIRGSPQIAGHIAI